jgi:aryl-alcohol dehydrogenase-like predicted oxidoreductase
MPRVLGKTGMTIDSPVLGGNVFGWTIDERASFDVLDAFHDHGGDAIDTADIYSVWAEGNQGGESETILGRWFHANPARRERMRVFTKVGGDFRDGRRGLAAPWIVQAVEDSLRRLRVERIDLYQAHWPDAGTRLEETLAAFEKLIAAGKVRAIGCSNLHATQLRTALRVARKAGLPAYQVLQAEYNLYSRWGLEGPLGKVARREGLGVLAHCSLARGFLTGKYRSAADLEASERGRDLRRYLNGRGRRILDALGQVADRHGATPAEVSLAWLLNQPGVTAPIASATSREQVRSLFKAGQLAIPEEDLRMLDRVSAGNGFWRGTRAIRGWLADAVRGVSAPFLVR